jgi:hypothetical protein
LANAGRDGQQVKVMVAKDDLCSGTEGRNLAQRGERRRAPIDEVAGEPKYRRRSLRDSREQGLKRAMAALQIADSDRAGQVACGFV